MIHSYILILSSFVFALNCDDKFEIIKVNTLSSHNSLRTKHKANPLKISSKLNKISQDWANHLARKDELRHRPKNANGENIYVIKSSKELTNLGHKAVESWYSEKKFFDFGGKEKKMSSTQKAFHFTQVVWKSSKELGQGAARSKKSGKIYVVCNYYPPGNIRNNFKANVLREK